MTGHCRMQKVQSVPRLLPTIVPDLFEPLQRTVDSFSIWTIWMSLRSGLVRASSLYTTPFQQHSLL